MLETFKPDQIRIVNHSVEMAEDLVSNHFKMSTSQWNSICRYDIKTSADLNPEEIVQGPFAQIIRYEGKKKDTSLGSLTYDFYKICLQDHSILAVLKQKTYLKLFPFVLYIITHELIHIIRFTKFLQNFDASPEEKLAEESRVHENTRVVLRNIQVQGMGDVLDFYNQWHLPLDGLRNPA
ncbi:MAG: hypothetical protein Q8P24_07885 [Desulfobacterales bacterium]|nr:hypothetical protein [Desulfobacterales bacterium]